MVEAEVLKVRGRVQTLPNSNTTGKEGREGKKNYSSGETGELSNLFYNRKKKGCLLLNVFKGKGRRGGKEGR